MGNPTNIESPVSKEKTIQPLSITGKKRILNEYVGKLRELSFEFSENNEAFREQAKFLSNEISARIAPWFKISSNQSDDARVTLGQMSGLLLQELDRLNTVQESDDDLPPLENIPIPELIEKVQNKAEETIESPMLIAPKKLVEKPLPTDREKHNILKEIVKSFPPSAFTSEKDMISVMENVRNTLSSWLFIPKYIPDSDIYNVYSRFTSEIRVFAAHYDKIIVQKNLLRGVFSHVLETMKHMTQENYISPRELITRIVTHPYVMHYEDRPVKDLYEKDDEYLTRLMDWMNVKSS